MARPTKLNAKTQKAICTALKAGNYYEAACGKVGVHYSNFRRWMERGEEETSGPYREFRDAVTKAVAEAEATIVSQWRAQIPDNWAAARDFLARRFPERWGAKDKLNVTHDIDALIARELERLAGRGQGSGAGTSAEDADAGTSSDGKPAGPDTH